MTRILLIDDDNAVRRLLREMLQTGGHEVVDASNGEKALKLLHDHPCELVVTDIFMPDMDGLATLMELRKTRPEIRVIAISGGSPRVGTDMLVAAKRLGAVRTLAKPILRADLLKAVEEAMAADVF